MGEVEVEESRGNGGDWMRRSETSISHDQQKVSNGWKKMKMDHLSSAHACRRTQPVTMSCLWQAGYCAVAALQCTVQLG